MTEFTSRSVLYLASYGFSLALAMITWVWIADRFDCPDIHSFDTIVIIGYLLIILFNLWYPVLGLYLLILVNKVLQGIGNFSGDDGSESEYNLNHYWVPPIAAGFAGCIAMMMFSFLSAVFLDIIDTLFLCFAIDKDNHVDLSDDVFCALVKELPEYIEAEAIMDNAHADTAILAKAEVVP